MTEKHFLELKDIYLIAKSITSDEYIQLSRGSIK